MRLALSFTHRAVCAALVLAVLCCALHAQQTVTSATVAGYVVDTNAAAVAGANVSVRNLETNFNRAATSMRQASKIAREWQDVSDANESVLDRRLGNSNYLVPSNFIAPRRLMVGAKFRF